MRRSALHVYNVYSLHMHVLDETPVHVKSKYGVRAKPVDPA